MGYLDLLLVGLRFLLGQLDILIGLGAGGHWHGKLIGLTRQGTRAIFFRLQH